MAFRIVVTMAFSPGNLFRVRRGRKSRTRRMRERSTSSTIAATTTVEVLQEFTHVRARRRSDQSSEWYRFMYHSFGGVPVSAITATEARKSLFGLIQQVNDDHTTVEVVSRRGNAVIMSKDDYDALTETAYLLRNPASAERLLEAVERARRGEFEQHDLVDP